MSSSNNSKPLASTSTYSTLNDKLLKLISNSDPSTIYFLRGFLLGSVSILPAIARIVISFILNRKNVKRISGAKTNFLKQLLKVVMKGLSPTSFAMSFGVAVGGAKYFESRVEPLVRKLYFEASKRINSRKEKKNSFKGKSPIEGESFEKKEQTDEKYIKALSTFFASTFAALTAITLLQSSSSYNRRRLNQSITLAESDKFGPSPYPSLTSPDTPIPSSSSPIGTSTPTFVVGQSPTLDLTLFVFVRGADTLIRYCYEHFGVSNGRGGKLLSFIANQADTLVFSLSVWRIMWCFFYEPTKLPPSYNRWILTLARMDPRLLQLLRYARAGEYVYGQKPSEAVALMSAGIAKQINKPSEFVNPLYIKRLDCSVVHAKLGEGSCEINALKRWLRAFVDALAIYGPVHLFPQLIFNLPSITSTPLKSLLHIVLAASRSSAFLATFIASIYASVCFARTRIPLLLLPKVNPQFWDSGFCAGLGCFMCGFSVLIENKRRRREMSLYVAPRAVYTLMDALVPTFLSQGLSGEFISRWIERWIFAISTGITLSATVHRPDLVSGVVRGIVGKAVGNWDGYGVKKLK